MYQYRLVNNFHGIFCFPCIKLPPSQPSPKGEGEKFLGICLAKLHWIIYETSMVSKHKQV
jgi:hypothetical protein